MKPIYLDYNGTTPTLPQVCEAMTPFLTEHFGNPASGHIWGLAAKRGVDRAREQTACLLEAEPDEIIFTSCATESNNMVLAGIAGPGDHMVVSAVEHPAIMEYIPVLQARGVDVTVAPVDRQGLVSLEAIEDACTGQTRLISVMLANNETGAIQPVAKIAAWARERGILVHTDAAQAVGKIQVDVRKLAVDMLTVAGHKLYAPKGVGALYVRRGVELRPLLHGGGQEGGRRSGTENVAHMAGLGAACALAAAELTAEKSRQEGLGKLLFNGVKALGYDFELHAENAPRLPNTMSLGFEGRAAGDIVSGLAGMDVGVSAGAACHGDVTDISHVLAAMGVPREYAEGTIRFSWGRPTSREDMEEVVQRLGKALKALA